jgi:hypothetical protein
MTADDQTDLGNGARLVSLTIADDATAWEAAGFTVVDSTVTIDGTAIHLTGRAEDRAHRGIRNITVSGLAAPAGSKLHAVAEDGIPTREIAEAIGRAFDLPVTSIDTNDMPTHFGWIGMFFGMDLSATSTATRELMHWTPTGPTLIEDLDAGAYSVNTRATQSA